MNNYEQFQLLCLELDTLVQKWTGSRYDVMNDPNGILNGIDDIDEANEKLLHMIIQLKKLTLPN